MSAKKSENHTVRITKKLKAAITLMTDEQMLAMNEDLRRTMAKHAHMRTFNYKDYLREEN